MPWVVRLSHGAERLPSDCPVCRGRRQGPPRTIRHRQEKSSLMIGGFVASKYLVYDIPVPICGGCLGTRKRLWTLLVAAFFGFGAPMLSFAFLDPLTLRSGLGPVLMVVSLLSLAIAGVLVIVLLWKWRRFRVAAVIGGRTTYAMASRSYAEEFASMNGEQARFRIYAGRLPFDGPTT